MNDSFEQAKRQFLDGVAHLAAGRPADAERCFESSLALLPGRVSTLVNLAAARIGLGRPDAALPLLDDALAQAPDDADAWFQRAQALLALQQPAPALQALDRVTALEPRRAVAWLRRAQALQALDRHADALAAAERSIAIEPASAPAWLQRGHLLREAGRLPEAADAFRQALAHGADPALAGYYLAATGGDTAPPEAPLPYVRALFDDYAATFDTHLAALGYHGHETLVAHLRALGDGRYASALDLGCGTGLCAPLLRPMVARLEGVDLSAAMLDKARARGLYDALAQADLVTHLAATPEGGHDLLVAADVFIYMGALEPVFDQAARVLAPRGVLCFSVEAADDADTCVLRPSLRYAHSARYLRTLASRHGLAVERLTDAPVRDDQQRAVRGLYACLRKT
jgi:predicted TPR repeat methyltransferase